MSNREKQREDELIRQVREAVTTLIAQGFYPSQKAISALVHISPGDSAIIHVLEPF